MSLAVPVFMVPEPVTVPAALLGLRFIVRLQSIVVETCVKFAVIVALPVRVTVVVALLALAIEAVVPVAIQFEKVYPLLAVAFISVALPASTVCDPEGVTEPPVPALTVNVCVAVITCVKFALTVILPLTVMDVDALFAFAIVPLPVPSVIVQPEKVYPVAAVADMFLTVPLVIFA